MATEVEEASCSNDYIFEAKASGYFFLLEDNIWTLDKNVKINVGQVAELLSGDVEEGLRRTLAYYASEYSSSHTKNCAERVQHMLRNTEEDEISETMLINYRASLTKATEWYLAVIRGFLKKWYSLGYPGISKQVIRMLEKWRLKGNRKGDAVKRKDPKAGPLTSMELLAFNEGVVQAFEKDSLSLYELSLCLLTSNTGRRPIQITHIRVMDLVRGKNEDGDFVYRLNVPRAKHGVGFRTIFKVFAITEELWEILCAQSKNSIERVEENFNIQLQESDRQQVPLFPDFNVVRKCATVVDFRNILKTDKPHISASEVTHVIKEAVRHVKPISERTGEVLAINSRRFRYTIGTRAADEGFGELVIAELLDHTDTQNAGVYVKNTAEQVKRLDEAVGFQLSTYAQAFAGVLVDSEKDASRGDDLTSRIRTEEGRGIGTCGEHGFCNANVPIPCYTCMHFQPWLEGPHHDVYDNLIKERDRLIEVTQDNRTPAVLDRTIVAVAEVIQRCERRREELEAEGASLDD